MKNIKMQRPYIYLSVFTCGVGVLLLEVCSSRLLAPYFGNSIMVWAILISFTLGFLTLGNFLGGKLADKKPSLQVMASLAAVAGGWNLAALWLAPIVLTFLSSLPAGWGIILSTSYLLGIPCILLGGITPFALRLLNMDRERTGTVAGMVMALSTAGGILGAVLPVLVGIPTMGTRSTIAVMSLVLIITGGAGFPKSLFLMLLAPLAFMIQGEPDVITFETIYATYQIRQSGEKRMLTVNDGESLYSVWHPRDVLLGTRVDACVLAPYMLAENSRWSNRRVLMLGLGGGSWVGQYHRAFSGLSFDGVEIDPGLMGPGREYFFWDTPGLSIHLMDARRFLRQNQDPYQVIMVDLYLGDQVPPHLATVEFFRLVRNNLAPDGVIVVNFPPQAWELGVATIGEIFPHICLIDGMIFASANPDFGPVNLAMSLDGEMHPQVESMIRQLLQERHRVVINPRPDARPLTDDRGPLL